MAAFYRRNRVSATLLSASNVFRCEYAGHDRLLPSASASMPFSASDGEKVAKPDEVSAGE
jgi:hypothetical protein